LINPAFTLFERNPLFEPPGPRDENILDVFPQFSMLGQIDLNGHLAALLIGYVLDSSHRLGSFTALTVDAS
jgi:hypothetical protein